MSRIFMVFFITLMMAQEMTNISVADIDIKKLQEFRTEKMMQENVMEFETVEEEAMQTPPVFPEFDDGETWELPVEINPGSDIAPPENNVDTENNLSGSLDDGNNMDMELPFIPVQ